MTMFRKVFGNHLTTNKSEMQVMDAMPPHDEPVIVASAPVGSEVGSKDLPTAVEPDVKPAQTALDAEQSDLLLSQRAALLAARAAEAQSKMMETQVARKAAPASPTQAAAVSPTIAPAASAAPLPRTQAGGRARTRLLGFDPGADDTSDPIAKASAGTEAPARNFPAGWIVIVKGPGLGTSFPVFNGVAMVGRGEDQAIRLDFGDTAISRQNHAAIAYDLEDNKFYIGHGGKSNIIRLNDRPLLSTETLSDGDMIRIGETSLRFVALCGGDFQWGSQKDV